MLSGVAHHVVWCGPPCCLVWPALLSGVACAEVKADRELYCIYFFRLQWRHLNIPFLKEIDILVFKK